MTVSRFFSPLLLTLLMVLSGCSLMQPQTVLYQLDSGALADKPTRVRNLVVQLEPVGVAEYLKGEQMVQRQPDDSLVIARHARWAGPLDSNLSEQLLRQLDARLAVEMLVLAPVPAGFKPDLQLQVDITRFDAGPSQPAVLEARWRMLDGRGAPRGSRQLRLSEPHLGTVADQVRAQNLLLQRLAAEVAQLVNSQPEQKVRQPAKPAPAAVPAPSKPRPPMPIPIRTDVEVFRF